MPQKVSLCRMLGDLSRLVVSPSPEPGFCVCLALHGTAVLS